MNFKRSILIFLMLGSLGTGQHIYRYGSTAANFLEIGVGSANVAMGDAGVTFSDGPPSVYWNPASLAFVTRNENAFMIQPWILDVDMMFVGSTIHVPRLGTFALSLTHIGYGDMEVTTMAQQEGTGEKFSANEFSAAFTYSRRIVEWFSFGASLKLINSKIWHSSANAVAVDLGAIVNTDFFSPNGRKENGMRIGMSISNYGTRMRYDGIDLLNPIDISPYEDGNYADVPGQFRPSQWELPLFFRIGVGLKPIYTDLHRVRVAMDAVHPNNNVEYINLGGEYELNIPGKGSLYLRTGYKSLFSDDSEFGLTYGVGLRINLMHNQVIQFDFAHRSMGLFGDLNSYTISIGL